MREYCGDGCYTPVHIKQNILQQFRNETFISEINCRVKVATFRSVA